MPVPEARAATVRGLTSPSTPSPAPQVVSAEAKDIVFDNASRQQMQAGINKIADAVASTLGPRGE
jgi:hypothetical protein